MIDAFANLEYSVSEAIKAMQLCADLEDAPLGQRLKILARLAPGPKLSKANAKIVADAAAKALSLCEIRNDLVHSRMQFVAGHPDIAIYINMRVINQPYPKARVLSIDQHDNLAKEAKAVAECLNEWSLSHKK